MRVNTGNDDFLPAPADYTYTLRYRTTRQLGFFKDFDELYWNAIGTGWAFPIESGRVRVRLPQAVPIERMQLDGYTGPQGAQGRDVRATASAPGEATWTLAQPLPAGAGMTLVIGFPKGLVTAPTRAQTLRWLLADNRGLLVALLGLVVLLAYCLRRWHQVGRDPRQGVVIARYQPPADHSPAALRFVQKMMHDTRCFSADLLDLAVRGHVRIEREKGLLRDQWTLTRLEGGDLDALPPPQRGLLKALFAAGNTLELKPDNAVTTRSAVMGQMKSLETAYSGRMFKRHGASVGIAFLILLAGIVPAFAVSGGYGIPLIIGVLVLMLVVLGVFAAMVRAPTPEGRALLDEIEGLKRYLTVAERDDLARITGPEAPPQLDAERYQALLPYAVALEVEDAWTDKFTLAVGAAAAAAATAGISWYRGAGIDSLSGFSKAVGSSLASQIASSSSPPGSSSGGGGGGSSGGGGGGGGGGGR
ncbi:MAG TPA: DUF2207 domain-containing protein [Thermomonas sp.]|nr:DUF2207 domain-containing protein [Thermomonas sp.]